MTRLEGGVFLNIGTAVMGPEVYLKALSMARNVAHQQGGEIRRFTTAVFDLPELGGQLHSEAPKTDPALLLPPVQDRAGADRGRRRDELLRPGRPRRTVPALYDAIIATGAGMR